MEGAEGLMDGQTIYLSTHRSQDGAVSIRLEDKQRRPLLDLTPRESVDLSDGLLTMVRRLMGDTYVEAIKRGRVG